MLSLPSRRCARPASRPLVLVVAIVSKLAFIGLVLVYGQAYLGTAVPGYPNLFTLYGPNTNGVTSIIYILEAQIAYVGRLLDAMAERGIIAIKAGTLDEVTDLQPTVHYWASSRQAWLPLPGDGLIKSRESSCACQLGGVSSSPPLWP